jgi:hypothetical protein
MRENSFCLYSIGSLILGSGLDCDATALSTFSFLMPLSWGSFNNDFPRPFCTSIVLHAAAHPLSSDRQLIYGLLIYGLLIYGLLADGLLAYGLLAYE